ncbi:hypothetical protein DQ239_15760 [Blastococcus sp. TF02-09]|nr:hypothetical protein DQ239_15760 [Blastococcus sp. TF02-9]RBY88605.1 hypothetical protein DQ240_04155 [Blastococcus sp. TF02A-26]
MSIMVEWRLVWVSPQRTPAPVEALWDEGQFERARALAQLDREPYAVFVPPSGVPDQRLLRYTTDHLANYAVDTQRTYATEIRVWLNFLVDTRGETDWCRATSDDVRNFEFFRRRDRRRLETEDSRGRKKTLITGSSWVKVLAAVSSLYRWAVSDKLITASPVVMSSGGPRRGSRHDRPSTPRAEQAPSNARKSNVRWLTRRAVERWRQIGFEDYGANGLPRGVERVRTQARNVAFVNLLYGTGMRRKEGGALLTLEIPADEGTRSMVTGWVPEALGKGGKGRWFYLERRYVRGLHAYIRFQRQQAVQRAQAQGRYERVEDRLLLVAVHGSGKGTEVTTLDPREPTAEPVRQRLDDLSAADRMRLYREVSTERGAVLEPLWLWLKDDGTPLPYREWDGIFRAANERLKREGVALFAMPHMLRHSYALHMLIAAQRAYLIDSGLDAEERRRYQRLFGNVWELVRDLLGHADVTTTRNWYLEPVRGLQMEWLMDMIHQPDGENSPVRDVKALETLVRETAKPDADASPADDIDAFETLVSQRSHRVLDVAGDEA